jgi:hypothetical protein
MWGLHLSPAFEQLKRPDRGRYFARDHWCGQRHRQQSEHEIRRHQHLAKANTANTLVYRGKTVADLNPAAAFLSDGLSGNRLAIRPLFPDKIGLAPYVNPNAGREA